MRKKINHVVSVELRGGLGNQFFGLAAGWLVSAKLEKNLILDGRFLKWHGSNPSRTLELDKFKFSSRPDITFRKTLPGLAGLITVRKLILKIIHTWSTFRDVPSTNDLWEKLFFIEKLAKNSGKIHGNFIDFRWAIEAQKYGFPKRVELRRYSASVANLLSDVAETCAIHIRLTDFLHYPSLFPQLSTLYFESAILEMNKRGFSKFTIFTDDLNLARETYPLIFDRKDIRIISNSLSSAETFFLMQSCAGIITSSSSYSSWAAFFIANQQGMVVCPSKLLLDGSPDPRPEEWIRLDHETGLLIHY
jgi:hypothetical protein